MSFIALETLRCVHWRSQSPDLAKETTFDCVRVKGLAASFRHTFFGAILIFLQNVMSLNPLWDREMLAILGRKHQASERVHLTQVPSIRNIASEQDMIASLRNKVALSMTSPRCTWDFLPPVRLNSHETLFTYSKTYHLIWKATSATWNVRQKRYYAWRVHDVLVGLSLSRSPKGPTRYLKHQISISRGCIASRVQWRLNTATFGDVYLFEKGRGVNTQMAFRVDGGGCERNMYKTKEYQVKISHRFPRAMSVRCYSPFISLTHLQDQWNLLYKIYLSKSLTVEDSKTRNCQNHSGLGSQKEGAWLLCIPLRTWLGGCRSAKHGLYQTYSSDGLVSCWCRVHWHAKMECH